MPDQVRAVVFDIGEVLVDESRLWARWADHLGVARGLFFSALGAIIERGAHHLDVFEEFRPGFDVDAAMVHDPTLGGFDGSDLYPDAAPCLERVRAAGYRVGVVGNQPRAAEQALDDAGVSADFVSSSAAWGVEKPDPRFFARVAEEAGSSPGEVAYVGDRLDNDVLPAVAAGMVAVFLRRGPWGHIHGRRPEVAAAHVVIDSLDPLPHVLEHLAHP